MNTTAFYTKCILRVNYINICIAIVVCNYVTRTEYKFVYIFKFVIIIQILYLTHTFVHYYDYMIYFRIFTMKTVSFRLCATW